MLAVGSYLKALTKEEFVKIYDVSSQAFIGSMDAHLTQPTELFIHVIEPKWSPDGQFIVSKFKTKQKFKGFIMDKSTCFVDLNII